MFISFFLIFLLYLTNNSAKMVLKVVENREAVITELCALVESSAKTSIASKGSFNIGVSGGSLITFLVSGLPKINTDYSKWKIFFCDERLVPQDDPESTFGAYKAKLVDTSAVNLTENQFVKVQQGVSALEAAKDYENQIKKHLPANPLPQFDLLLLGMGPDGHTCSLFPGHQLLNEKSAWVAPITDSPKPPPSRITLTFPVINNAKVCAFAVSGKEKAEMIQRIHGLKENLPAARVQPTNGEVYWIVDKDAAGLLS